MILRSRAALRYSVSALLAIMLLSGGALLRAQDETRPMEESAHPHFEVATIKLSPDDPSRNSFKVRGQKVTCSYQTLNNIVAYAFGVHVREITNSPPWFATDRYDVDGFPNVPGKPNHKQVQEMYQQLLADRFNFQFHRDKKQLAVFVIAKAKFGPSLTKSKEDPSAGSGSRGNQDNGALSVKFTNTSMPDLAHTLSFYVDRPVMDETAIDGRYDFVLRWLNDDSKQTDNDSPPGLSTALQEQLGLTLVGGKRDAEVLFIDHVSKPSPN